MLDMTYEEYMGNLFKMNFNGIDINDYLSQYSSYFYVLEVSGRSLSPNDIQATQMANGSYRFKKKRKTPVPLVVKAMLITPFDNDLRIVINALNGLFNTEKPAPIVFSDEPEFTYFGIVNTISEGTESNGSHIVTITFWRDEATKQKNEKTINVTTTAQTHTITGQAETPWSIEINFTANTNRFEFWAGDIYLQLNYDFIEGDRLTINYTGREVWLRDVDLRTSVSMSSNFEELQPGTTSFRASHNCVVKYTERYY